MGGVPARLEAAVFDAGLAGLVQADAVEGDAAQDGEVLRRVALAHPRLVFAVGHVQQPVQAVLDGPVPVYGGTQVFGIGLARTDVVAPLQAGFAVDFAAALDQDQRLQPRPAPPRRPARLDAPLFGEPEVPGF